LLKEVPASTASESHRLAGVLQQVLQRGKGFRPERNGPVAMPQDLARRVEPELAEDELFLSLHDANTGNRFPQRWNFAFEPR